MLWIAGLAIAGCSSNAGPPPVEVDSREDTIELTDRSGDPQDASDIADVQEDATSETTEFDGTDLPFDVSSDRSDLDADGAIFDRVEDEDSLFVADQDAQAESDSIEDPDATIDGSADIARDFSRPVAPPKLSFPPNGYPMMWVNTPLRWEDQGHSEENLVEVATDSDFNDIVFEATAATLETEVSAEGLEARSWPMAPANTRDSPNT